MGTAGNVEVFEKMPVAKAVSSMAVPTVIGQLILPAELCVCRHHKIHSDACLHI